MVNQKSPLVCVRHLIVNLGLPMCLTMHNVYELKYMVYFVRMFISFRYGDV